MEKKEKATECSGLNGGPQKGMSTHKPSKTVSVEKRSLQI